MELPHITTQTHNIKAHYTFTPGTVASELDTSGDTLQEVVDDMLGFLNDWDAVATLFELDTRQEPTDLADFKLEMAGEVFTEDGDNPHGEDDVIPMHVTITVQER